MSLHNFFRIYIHDFCFPSCYLLYSRMKVEANKAMKVKPEARISVAPRICVMKDQRDKTTQNIYINLWNKWVYYTFFLRLQIYGFYSLSCYVLCAVEWKPRLIKRWKLNPRLGSARFMNLYNKRPIASQGIYEAFQRQETPRKATRGFSWVNGFLSLKRDAIRSRSSGGGVDLLIPNRAYRT